MEIDVSKLGLIQEEEPQEDPLVIILRTFIGSEPCRAEGSIIDTIDVGTPIVLKRPTEPLFATPLFKEDLLSNFKTEREKALVRSNLGIYSAQQVDEILTKVIGDNLDNYLTKNEVLEAVKDLDYVKSTEKKLIDYDIPERLFI